MSPETQPIGDPADLAGSIALFVEDLPGPASPKIVDSGATRYVVTTNAIYAYAISVRSPSATSVRGNRLNGAGDIPAVVVGFVGEKPNRDYSRFGPLTFAENFCDLDGRGMQPDSQPVAVSLAAQGARPARQPDPFDVGRRRPRRPRRGRARSAIGRRRHRHGQHHRGRDRRQLGAAPAAVAAPQHPAELGRNEAWHASHEPGRVRRSTS